MTAKVACRYLVTGHALDIPQIFPGTLAGISFAMREVQRVSRRLPGRYSLDAVYDGERFPFRVYENGECVEQREQPTAT